MHNLISESYRELNARALREQDDFGRSGHRWIAPTLQAAKAMGATNVLDYGAGKGHLARGLRGTLTVREYDPSIPELAAMPQPADLVTCTDVIEHIEPECLDAVLAHIRSLARIGVLLVISCERGTRKLADGRYAHLIVESPDWWRKKLTPIFGKFTEFKGVDKKIEFRGWARCA